MSRPIVGEESWLDRNRLSESSRRDWRDEERPKPEPEPACAACLRDEIEINDAGLCCDCQPTEDETTVEWLTRLRGRGV